MCSFDVSSLFTNVPLDELYIFFFDKLYALPDPPTLPRSVLKVLLEFTTKRRHFIFDGQYYDQIDGVAMGSPLGPILANIFTCLILKRNGFLTTTLALLFGFGTLTIPSPCLTVNTQQFSFCTTSITVTQTLNSPLNLKRTTQSLSWAFSSNDTVILCHLTSVYPGRRPLPACTQNGTPSHLGNAKWTSSARSLFVVSASVHHLPCCALVWMNWGSCCYKTDTLLVLSIIASMMFWTDSKTERRIQSPQSPKRILSQLTTCINEFMVAFILRLFSKALIASSLFSL